MNVVSPVEAARALREGKVALVPTETVVGLVSAESGLARLWEIKGRDPGKPIALLCPTADDAFALAKNISSLARKLAGLYWPGPLTLVLDHRVGGTVGVRVPGESAVRRVLDAYGEPLYATSANLAGEPAPGALEAVDARVRAEVDVVVEGEPGDGEASAVVDLSGGRVRLLRAAEGLSEEKLSHLAADEPR